MACDKKQSTITGSISSKDRAIDELDPLALRGLPVKNYPRPVAPRNFRVFHAYTTGVFDLCWDSPYIDPRNAEHVVTGVNVYRSIDSSEGPWTLVNSSPLTVDFYRDQSQNIAVVDEVVNNTTHLRIEEHCVVIQTQNYPLVFSETDQTLLTDTDLITVKIDGKQVMVKSINSWTGEIELFSEPEYDPVFERFIDLPVPTNSSVIEISYVYNNLVLQDDRLVDQRIFYKVTSVTNDGNETRIADAPIASYQDLDALTYIWKNIISKQKFLLEQAGEVAKVFIQRSAGVRCTEHDILDRELYGDDERRTCPVCYGTGFEGGYIGPFDLLIGNFDAATTYKRANKGRKKTKSQETFTINYPVLRQGDIIVRQNGERYVVGPVRRKESNGLLLQQDFELHILQPSDILYKITIPGVPDIYPKIDKPTVPDYKEVKGKSARFSNIERM